MGLVVIASSDACISFLNALSIPSCFKILNRLQFTKRFAIKVKFLNDMIILQSLKSIRELHKTFDKKFKSIRLLKCVK